MKPWILVAIFVLPLVGCAGYQERQRLREEMKRDSVGERGALQHGPGRFAVE
ncbi:MAG: hypothetical protein P4L84_32395 [Isosphaeraceae bacterium]|nr:hypothetical protein [Isosphaeraceae bacterium]